MKELDFDKLQEKFFSGRQEEMILELFASQFKHNVVYQNYCISLGRNPENVKVMTDIPFLPVSAFKHQEIKSGHWQPEVMFSSSSTSSQIPSRHFMPSLDKYLTHTVRCFACYYGDITEYTLFALLPSYLDRKGSSLVAMADHFIKQSKNPESGFFLSNLDNLIDKMRNALENREKIILLGVTFALLDLAEKYQLPLNDAIIMETGGMKGRRKEMPREEIHHFLKERLGVSDIHSEYGMTEMSSQMYSVGQGVFVENPFCKVFIHDLTDPLTIAETYKTGSISVIDLANIHSCAFLRTDDLGKYLGQGKFEVLGRVDHSEIRGCNLMVSDLLN